MRELHCGVMRVRYQWRMKMRRLAKPKEKAARYRLNAARAQIALMNLTLPK
jgi:hypothetical protein